MAYAEISARGALPLLRSLPEQAVMCDLYKSQPASSKPLGELTEVAMRGPEATTRPCRPSRSFGFPRQQLRQLNDVDGDAARLVAG
jgi:hypothetical protein